MKEIIITTNEANQRIDRFLKKYLNKAPNSFIYKMLRKKNITLNGKKTEPEQMINEGDSIKLFLSDETIEKFREEIEIDSHLGGIDIIYEDDNLLLLNKPEGIISHKAKMYEDNLLDRAINYLIAKGDYVPRLEKTFTPALANRLDYHTSGLIIIAKNYPFLIAVNKALREGFITKRYIAIAKGELKKEVNRKSYILKNEEKNKVKTVSSSTVGAKEIRTRLSPIKISNGYSLINITLYTGRTHQIRVELKEMGLSLIGDDKYGDKRLNNKLGLHGQFLHCEKLIFNFTGEFSYLNQSFKSPLSIEREKIYRAIFKE